MKRRILGALLILLIPAVLMGATWRTDFQMLSAYNEGLFSVIELDTATNTVSPVLKLTHTTTGTPAAGIGGSIEMYQQTASANTELGGRIGLVSTDVTSTSEDFDIVFYNMAAGATAAETFRITSTGAMASTGAFTASAVHLIDNTTAAYDTILDSDSDGSVLTADRTVTFDVNNADRGIDLSGDLTVEASSIINQDLSSDANVDFNRVDADDFYWEDEFVVVDRAQWTTDVTTGSVAIQAADNGTNRLTTGATATNEESLDWNDLTPFKNTLQPVLEIRFQLEQTTNIEVVIGLTESVAVGSDDYIEFIFDASAAATWKLEASKAASAASDVGAAADTSMNTFRLEWNSDTEVEWYINGASQGTIATSANIPVVGLQPTIKVLTEENAAHYIDVEYLKLWQDRS
jgi:hypothetical protein